jgi:hypothetical protein
VTSPEASPPPASSSSPPAASTDVSPPLEPAAAASPSPARKSSALRRFANWFWRGQQVKQAVGVWRAQRAAAGALEDRARLLFVCAERLQRPVEKLPGSTDAVAADLFRQAAVAARSALDQAGGSGAPKPLDPSSSNDVWELPPEQQALRARELSAVARGLLDELDAPRRARDALLLQRALRLGAVVALFAGLFGAVSFWFGRVEEGRDLADGKAWRASSSYNNMGCVSPVQQCSESPDFFFHTHEESNSWVEIDLGRRVPFSAVRVLNRRDCCFERAVPLIVEVSDTQEGFREVARRTSSFKSWLASFSPTQARYVRVRAPSRTALHLAQVRILR